MSFWVAGALVVSTAATTIQAKKAAKKGRKQADADAAAARKAEVFAETEGEGVAPSGRISLETDEEVSDEELSLRQGSSVRI